MTTTKQSGGLPERHKAHLSRPPIKQWNRDMNIADREHAVKYEKIQTGELHSKSVKNNRRQTDRQYECK